MIIGTGERLLSTL